jgi:Zn-dependent protease
MDPSRLEEIVLSIPVLLLAFCVHEFMHAWVALRQGDDTAFLQGRVTLDPRAHLDPIGSILFPLISRITGGPLIGWARPTPTDPRKFRSYQRDDILVSLAGVFGNLLLALLFAALHLGVVMVERSTGVTAVLGTADRLFKLGVELNVLLILFNLLPVPPLDGSRVVYHILPASLARAYRQLTPYGMIILYILLLTGALGTLFGAAKSVRNLLLGLDRLVA